MATNDYGHDEGGSDSMALVEGPPAWPKVIGGISLGFSVLMLGCTGCGAGFMALGTMTSGFMQQMFDDGLPPIMTSPNVGQWLSLGFGALVQVLLLAAGVLLLMRKPVARPLHLVYAVVAMVSAVLSIWIQMKVQAEVTQWVNKNPNTKFAIQQRQGGMIGQVIGWVLGLGLGFSWPLFCLVWFLTIKKDNAEIAKGADQLM